MDTQNIQNPQKQRFIFALVGIVLISTIVVVSLLRDRIVNTPYNQITVMGEGRVSYIPDTALVTLGVRTMKSATAELALSLTNQKMNAIIAAIKTLNIPAEDIQTQNLSLYPEYDYKEGVSIPSGYTASQQVTVKIRNLNVADPSMVSRIITESSKLGANEILGVTFEASNMGELKQQARVKAIEEAKKNAPALADASGVRLGKIVGWYENVLSGGPYQKMYAEGMGGGGGAMPSLPSGSQEIVVEVGINYKVR